MVRSFHVEGARVSKFGPIVRANLAREAKMMTDESRFTPRSATSSLRTSPSITSTKECARYTNVRQFPAGEEFVIHTNTIEGYFAIFKRGMSGVYQHCGEKHLHRYLAEFDFRYSNCSARGIEDRERADILVAKTTQTVRRTTVSKSWR